MTNQQLEKTNQRFEEFKQVTDLLQLKVNQQQQILDQYRSAIYNLELRSDLLIKMMEEKGLMAKDEFNKRWPLYLKSDIGTIEADGKMSGSLKTTIYG